jgi:hypothetical protein
MSAEVSNLWREHHDICSQPFVQTMGAPGQLLVDHASKAVSLLVDESRRGIKGKAVMTKMQVNLRT